MIAAIVPGAGKSERMGTPKLTLPVGGVTVIARVVTALMAGGAANVVVVSPPIDAPGAVDLIEEASGAGASVIVPLTRPPEMRVSFELGLAHLERTGQIPTTVLLAPGDSPGMSSTLVSAVIVRAQASPESIVVPTFCGRRGHPIALPWGLAVQVRELSAGVGVNALIAMRSGSVIELPLEESGAVEDLDTPADYLRYVEKEGDTKLCE